MFKRPVTGKLKTAAAQQAKKPVANTKKTEQTEIDIVSMIQQRDFSGAIAVLEVCLIRR